MKSTTALLLLLGAGLAACGQPGPLYMPTPPARPAPAAPGAEAPAAPVPSSPASTK